MSLSDLLQDQFLKLPGRVSYHTSYHMAYLTNFILFSIVTIINKDDISAAERLFLIPYDGFPDGKLLVHTESSKPFMSVYVPTYQVQQCQLS